MARQFEQPSITLKGVAEKAGVSYQTVSRAINGHGEISDATRARVLNVVREMGYRPNRVAGSLRTNRSKTIGLVMSDIENVFFAEVVSGVEAAATARGYQVLLANSGEDIDRERQAIGSLIERRVDGLIVAPAEGDHRYLAQELPKNFPLVSINRAINDMPCSAVLTQNQAGARTATEYLISRGHQRIAIITGSFGLMTSQERVVGFKEAMIKANLPIRNDWVLAGGIQPEYGRRVAMQIFSSPDRPTALFATSSRLVEGVLIALRELGLRRGLDVDVIGFDDVQWARFVDPPLPVVAQAARQIGTEAVRLVLDLLEGVVRVHQVVRLPTHLITGALPGTEFPLGSIGALRSKTSSGEPAAGHMDEDQSR
jgi:LacI family transcriptional regulator